MSDPNNILEKWILRDILNLEPRAIVNNKILNEIGINSVKLTKLEKDLYLLEPALFGLYKKFEKNINTIKLLRKSEMPKYDYNDIKYEIVKDKIQHLLQSHDKEIVRNLTVGGLEPSMFIQVYLTEPGFPEDFDLEQWQGVFDHVINTKKKTIGLIKGAVNDAEISRERGSQWFRYKNALKKKKYSARDWEKTSLK